MCAKGLKKGLMIGAEFFWPCPLKKKKKKTDRCVFWVEYLGLRKNKQKQTEKNKQNKETNKQKQKNCRILQI